MPAITRKYKEKFIELFAIMELLVRTLNCIKFEIILCLNCMMHFMNFQKQ